MTNQSIAESIIKKIDSQRGIILINRVCFNKNTGKDSILDVFVYNRKASFFDFFFSVDASSDPEINLPYYLMDIILNFLKKYLPDYKVFSFSEIDQDNMPGILVKDIENNKNDDLSEKNILDLEYRKKFFEINLLKIQQFLNYMDTDSIPMYFKNICVKYNEIEEYEKALFFIRLALKENKNSDIIDQFYICLLKLNKFDAIIRLKNVTSTYMVLCAVAYSFKMKEKIEEALSVYTRIVDTFEDCDQYIFKEIDLLTKRLDNK